MSRKNLQHISLNTAEKTADNDRKNTHFSSENQGIRTVYSESDLEAVYHLDFAAGIAPYLRGISSTMYVQSAWETHQSAYFNTPKDYNTFYKQLYTAGQHHFYLELTWDQNKSFCLEDFKIIFKDIPLDKISIAIKNNATVLPLLAFYIVTAEAQGVKTDTLKGRFTIDVLSDLNSTNTVHHSEKLNSDILRHTYPQLPLFNTYSLSIGAVHHLNPETELALLLISGNKQLKENLASGLKIDDIAPRLTFNFSIGLHHFSEIAKLRAARLLWAKIVKSYHPKHEASLALQCNATINSTNSLDPDIDNVVTKTTIKTTAAVFGGVQALETQSLKNTSQESERLERNIQYYLQAETQITKTVDPWAGSYYVEKHTHDIAEKAWDIFEYYQTNNILPDTICSELLPFESNSLEDVSTTEHSQKRALDRDEVHVKNALLNVAELVETSNENLLNAVIKAVKAKATYCEIYKTLI